MDKVEKASELIEQARKVGLQLEFRDGLNMLKVPASADREAVTLMLEQLAKYLPEVREICRRRAVGALAKNLVSRRIWSREHGEGTLVDASEDGTLTISIGAEVRKSHEEEVRRLQSAITANAESLLIVVDEPAEAVTEIDVAKPPTENRRMGVFEFLRRRATDSDGGGL